MPSAYASVVQLILLALLLPADFDPATCKLPCAVFNEKNHPIDVLATNPAVGQRGSALESVLRRRGAGGPRRVAAGTTFPGRAVGHVLSRTYRLIR